MTQNQNVYALIHEHGRLVRSQLLNESPVTWRQRWSEDASDTLPKPLFWHTKLEAVFSVDPSGVERIGFVLVLLFFIWRPSCCGCSCCECFRLGCRASCFRGLWFQLETVSNQFHAIVSAMLTSLLRAAAFSSWTFRFVSSLRLRACSSFFMAFSWSVKNFRC